MKHIEHRNLHRESSRPPRSHLQPHLRPQCAGRLGGVAAARLHRAGLNQRRRLSLRQLPAVRPRQRLAFRRMRSCMRKKNVTTLRQTESAASAFACVSCQPRGLAFSVVEVWLISKQLSQQDSIVVNCNNAGVDKIGRKAEEHTL